MASGLGDLGRLFTGSAVQQAVRYVGREPERYIPKILDFAHRFASPEQKVKIERLRHRVSTDEGIMNQVRRLAKNTRFLESFLSGWVMNYVLLGPARREKLGRELGVHIPYFLLLDPTSACNLRCKGCWAGEYAVATWPPELFDRVLTEAEELGMSWIVLSGGEPFAYRPLLDIVARHPRQVFMAYTNGTLIDDEVADQLLELSTVSPAISLEGFREATDGRRGDGVFDQVVATMDRLRKRAIPFGASVTVTRHNYRELFSDEFIDFLVDKGVVYMWSFHYIPVGRDPELELMLRPEQRAWLKHRVDELRQRKPLLIADFWNDGEFVGGCIAGGRLYAHINADGDCEPCAFAHFATDNIRDKSLLEVIGGPLFKAYQEHQPFNENHLAPCPIIDNPHMLRQVVAESGARATHDGAAEMLTGKTAEFLDKLSAEWCRLANEIVAEREKVTTDDEQRELAGG